MFHFLPLKLIFQGLSPIYLSAENKKTKSKNYVSLSGFTNKISLCSSFGCKMLVFCLCTQRDIKKWILRSPHIEKDIVYYDYAKILSISDCIE